MTVRYSRRNPMPSRPFPLLPGSPNRIVSLVPSTTESLFDLGLGGRLVGITDYCIHPAEQVKKLSKAGGTKNIRIEKIVELMPDLVIANQEENSREDIERLEGLGIPVWLTFPWTVSEAMEDLWNLIRACPTDAGFRTLRVLENTIEYTRLAASDKPPLRYFCPIWAGKIEDGEPWWMTFNGYTYSSDLLALLGGENVFAGRLRRYPIGADLGIEPEEPAGDQDTRYPRVRLREVVAAHPEMILLPDEPYRFEEGDAQSIRRMLEAQLGMEIKVMRIDGSLITWPGTRAARAVDILGEVFARN
jgi:iron complex transport system substrate-binding protein